MIEKVVKRLEYCTENKCDICQEENGSGFPWIDGRCYGFTERLYDALALLEAQESMKQNGEQYQCNKCKYYEGVHNIAGHAPCSFWNIGGVMWNDYCSRYCPNCGAKMDEEK